MRITTFYLCLAFCFAILISTAHGQNSATVIVNAPDSKDAKPAASPSPSPPPVSFNFADRPDSKAYMALVQERDIVKRLAASEKFIIDFPESFYLTMVQMQKLDDFIKQTPADKGRIYQQAQTVLNSVKKDLPFAQSSEYSRIYSQVSSSLYRAGLYDKSEEVALKGITLTDEANAKEMLDAKRALWQRLGQIYLRNNDLKKAESYFKQSITGDYEGNTSLLGLAEVYGKRKKSKQQLDYLILADAKGAMKKDQRETLASLYAKQHGSTKGLREMLDENYKRENPLPIKEVKYTATAKRSGRTVLAELFTGAECHPCITIDTAFEALLNRYNPSDVAVLIYDLHIPGPDPLTNPATVARGKFYNVNSTPTYFINGDDRKTGGGINRKQAQIFFDQIAPKIDAQLEQANEANLKLSASLENNSVKTVADFSNLKSDSKDLRLYIGLVENEISYMGGNGVRFHPMVVRELGGETRSGFALKDKSGKIEWQFDLPKISGDIKAYLDKYELDRQKDAADFAFTEKKDVIDSQDLSVVAFIQDDKTKKILQSAFINLAKSESK